MVAPVTKQLALSSKPAFCNVPVSLKLGLCKPVSALPADSLFDSTSRGQDREIIRLEEKKGTFPFQCTPRWLPDCFQFLRASPW